MSDFSLTSTPEPKKRRYANSAPRPVNKEQWVKNPCDCEAGGGAYLYHYGVMRCACGRRFWALRPKKEGPMVAFPFPGHWWETVRVPE
jgi:hypothetical protein